MTLNGRSSQLMPFLLFILVLLNIKCIPNIKDYRLTYTDHLCYDVEGSSYSFFSHYQT